MGLDFKHFQVFIVAKGVAMHKNATKHYFLLMFAVLYLQNSFASCMIVLSESIIKIFEFLGHKKGSSTLTNHIFMHMILHRG